MSARGIRNNNPGNIDFNPLNAWLGQIGLEVGVAKPRFARFDTTAQPPSDGGVSQAGYLCIRKRLRNVVASRL